MFGFETNQQQINKLEKKLANLSTTVNGGLYDYGLGGTIRELKDNVKYLTDSNENLRKRMSVLEEIVRESGLITDFTDDEVKIREDRKFDIFGGVDVKKVPYQINKVKVL